MQLEGVVGQAFNRIITLDRFLDNSLSVPSIYLIRGIEEEADDDYPVTDDDDAGKYHPE